MVLSYSNITVQLKEISLKNRPQELLDISSKGTVPVLYINNSLILDESLDIMKWALNNHDPDSWSNYKKKIQLDIIDVYDNEFKYWLDRYKYYDRYPENNQIYYRNLCDGHLLKLNSSLENNQYLLGNELLLVDVALFPFIRQFANVDKNWFNDTYLNLSKWLENFIESDLFISVMDKYPEYKPTQEPMHINFNE